MAFQTQSRHHWREERSAAAGGVSDPVLLPRRIDGVTAVVVPGAGGSAYVEYTLSDARKVLEGDPGAIWIPWESGSVVTATARALAGPVIALRLQAVGQPAVLQVAAWADF